MSKWTEIYGDVSIIPKQLRDHAVRNMDTILMQDAADRIEELEAVLRESRGIIANWRGICDNGSESQASANRLLGRIGKALEGKD